MNERELLNGRPKKKKSSSDRMNARGDRMQIVIDVIKLIFVSNPNVDFIRKCITIHFE